MQNLAKNCKMFSDYMHSLGKTFHPHRDCCHDLHLKSKTVTLHSKVSRKFRKLVHKTDLFSRFKDYMRVFLNSNTNHYWKTS